MFLPLNRKYQIAEHIKALITTQGNKKVYVNGWNDSRVAREHGVTPGQVTYVRKQIFPDLAVTKGSVGRPSKYKAMIESQSEEISDLKTHLKKQLELTLQVEERLLKVEALVGLSNKHAA